MSQGIYCIEHKISKKRYYGSSQNIEKRLEQHKSDLAKNKHHNRYLQRVFNKNNEILNFYLLEKTYLTQKQLFEYEQHFIDKNIGGYNLAPASGGNILEFHPNKEKIFKQISKSIKDNISELSEAEKKTKYGRKGSLNANWRNGGLSRKLCPECKQQSISVTSHVCSKCRDRTGDRNPFFGKHHSDQVKKDLSKLNSGNNSWIKDINPSQLPYTKSYNIKYKDGTTKTVAGLKIIANEFDTSIQNIFRIIRNCGNGQYPQHGKLAGICITAET